MFYKAAANPELVSIEPVPLRESPGLGSDEPLVTTVHQLIDPLPCFMCIPVYRHLPNRLWIRSH